MSSRPEELPQFGVYDGPVEAPFQSTDQEVLADLLAVIRATALKPVCLTKAGIPPKPLWTAINRLLVWKDLNGILYDWEEADQVRFTYRLAEGLDLIRPDEEGWLHLGPGAEQFFLAGSYQRALLLRRAYFNLYDWDERCDARDTSGHRYNFGQAFRRDFIHDVQVLREFSFRYLKAIPHQAWVATVQLARALTTACPDLLLSEVCEPPEIGEDGVDPEILRFVNYWLSILSRFGWVDLARAIGDDAVTGRLCRLTPLGWALIHEQPFADPEPEVFLIDDRMILELKAEATRVSDLFVTWRLGQPEEYPAADGPRALRLTRAGLHKAIQQGVDLRDALGWVQRHCRTPLPPKLRAWEEDLLRARRMVSLVQNAVVLDLNGVEPAMRESLRQVGFRFQGDLLVVAGPEVPVLFSMLGGEPEEGFDYPPDEPYARWKPGPALEMIYTELPLLHRDLLLALGIQGDPATITFTRSNLAPLFEKGWTLQEVLDALQALTLKPVPGRIKKQIEELLGEAETPRS
ncbi:MAG: hypothetical protein JW797_12760 [Bradymonadales bacterium]|nr:hypothetical protein [Bradymonadales bacterium]